MNIGKIIFIFFLIQAFSIISIVDCDAQDTPTVSDRSAKIAEMSWVKQSDKGNAVFYSFLQGDTWNEPVQLSEGEQQNLVPTMASGQESDLTFVAWAVMKDAGSHLRYTILKNGTVESRPIRIDTGMSANMAPFLAVDIDGIPWLVWSGNNGKTSDVYVSRWENARWLPPQRVHGENDHPDILPELQVEPDGSVLVRWNTYGPDGFMVVSKTLKTGEELLEANTAGTDWTKGAEANTTVCVEKYPAQDIELDKAALLIRCREGILPVQIRSPGELLQ